MKFKSSSGVATLPAIMALTILILAVGIGVTALGFTEVFISAGQDQSARAYIFAETGARDALQRITRDKTYVCATTDCYSIDFATSGCSTNEACARVSVSAGVGSSVNPKVITSKGQVKVNIRTVQVNVIFDDSLNGELATTTWQEVTN